MSRTTPSHVVLGSDEIHVWYTFTEELDDEGERSALAILSPAEHERYARFRFAHDRREYAVAHALLRRTLSRYADRRPADWTFEVGNYGKPRLPVSDRTASKLSFNLSHTRGLVACAIAPGVDVGVDAECLDRKVDWPQIMRRWCSTAEMAEVAGCPPDGRDALFLELWTLKESYLKAIGTGLSGSANAVDLAGAMKSRTPLGPNANLRAGNTQFGLFVPHPRYRIAAATRCASNRAWRIADFAEPGSALADPAPRKTDY